MKYISLDDSDHCRRPEVAAEVVGIPVVQLFLHAIILQFRIYPLIHLIS